MVRCSECFLFGLRGGGGIHACCSRSFFLGVSWVYPSMSVVLVLFLFAWGGGGGYPCVLFSHFECFGPEMGACTAWCSEIGSLTSLHACNSGASSDVREPISLHQAVHPYNKGCDPCHPGVVSIGPESNCDVFLLCYFNLCMVIVPIRFWWWNVVNVTVPAMWTGVGTNRGLIFHQQKLTWIFLNLNLLRTRTTR